MCANVPRCPAFFSENADYVPLLLAPFGAIASLSSEKNAVNKSSALTMNRFPSRCASTQKSNPCFGKVLGDAVKTSPLRATEDLFHVATRHGRRYL